MEKAEALLRTFFTDTELSQMLVHGVSNRVDVAPRPNLPTISDSSPFHRGSAPDALGHSGPSLATGGRAGTGANGRRGSLSSAGPEQDQKFDVGLLESPLSSRPTVVDNSPLPFENLPAADDDFEWDERESSWGLADSGGSAAGFEGGIEADIPKITDGMATLTADDSNSGFLGSVSGAALLRLIWNGSGTEKIDGKNEGRNSLEQLFNNRHDDYQSPSPWLRTQPLITRAVVNTLVDAYFALYHPTFPILHEPTFREQYSKLNGRSGGNTWQILANLVAALGSFVSSTCSDDTHTILFNAVKANLSIGALETGSLSLVQAFAMAANYLQKRNRPNSGYNYGGIALRLAISLGLHKEFRNWETAPFKKEIRRRVWWSLCVLDVGATVTYGRPLNWPQVGVDIPFPLNIHEKVSRLLSPFGVPRAGPGTNINTAQDLPTNSPSLPPEVNETTIYTYIRTQSAYHLRTIRIYNRLISSPVPSAAELISLDDELIEGWLCGLPPYFCDDNLPLPTEFLLGHAISRWRFRIMRIIMYRPFLIRWAQDGFGGPQSPTSPSQAPTPENIATNRCFKAAEDCISAIFQFWSFGQHTRLAAWYVL